MKIVKHINVSENDNNDYSLLPELKDLVCIGFKEFRDGELTDEDFLIAVDSLDVIALDIRDDNFTIVSSFYYAKP